MDEVQTASSVLESLIYSLLNVATRGQLPWAHLPHTDTMFAKLGCMTQSSLFDREIGIRLEPSLKAIAQNLHGLFYFNQQYKPYVNASAFIATLEMLA